MAIEMTALWREVKLISAGGIKPVFYRWELTLHANGVDITPFYVETADLLRNYVKNHADVWVVRVSIGPGDYSKKILPYKATLEATVRKIPLVEGGNAEDKSQPVETLRFRAIPIDTSSDQITGKSITAHNTDAANMSDVQSVTFQLLDPVTERLRMVTVGGIARGTKATEVIRGILGHFSSKYSKDGDIGPLGVDIAENATDKPRDHFPIPHSTPLFNVPEIIHETCGGVYNGGIAFYYQNRIWYVFPPYDVTRYDRSTKSLTIFNIPANRMPEPDRTYRTTPSQVLILATGDTEHIDPSDHRQLNEGNGVRFVDAKKMFEGFLTVDGNKAFIDKTKNMNEFVFEQRESGLNMVKESSNRITDNYPREFSKLAFRNGAFVQVVWENSKESLLYPGMPVRYVYIEDNVAQELKGVLVGTDSFTSPATPGPAPKRYVTKTALTVFVNRKITVGKKVLV